MHGLEAKVGYSNEYVRVEDIASAEGKKLRLPKAISSLGLGGVGSVVSSHSGVWGGAPETTRFLTFHTKWSTFSTLLNLIFCNSQIEKIVS